MYGVNVRYMYPFVAACLGSAIGTELAVISGTSSYMSGNGAWLGILNVQSQSKISGVTTWPGTGYTWFMISMITTTTTTILLTIIFSKIKYFKKFNIEISAAKTMLEQQKRKRIAKIAQFKKEIYENPRTYLSNISRNL